MCKRVCFTCSKASAFAGVAVALRSLELSMCHLDTGMAQPVSASRMHCKSKRSRI